MMVSYENILLPSLHGVANQADLNFFIPTLNGAIGEDLLWLPDRYDFVKAENSTFVMAGGSAAAGLVSGDSSTAYLEGLDKTLLSTSTSLNLSAKNSNFTLIYSEDYTTDIVVTAENSNATVLNISPAQFDISNFEINDDLLQYQSDQTSLIFDLSDGSAISLYSTSGIEPLSITFADGEYVVKIGVETESLFTEVNLTAEEITSAETKSIGEVNSDQSDTGTLPEQTLSEHLFSSDDLELYNELENIYGDLERLEAEAAAEQFLEQFSSNSADASIDQLLSSAGDDLIFDASQEATITNDIALEQTHYDNELSIEKVLSTDSYVDHIFESAIEFYDEI